MSKRNYKLFIKDIKDCSDRILVYIRNKSFKDLSEDDLLKDGIVRNLEVIGEAVKNIPYNIKHKYPQVEWKKLAGLRDILIHEYFGIDNEVLWDIVNNKIPDLNKSISQILKLESG